MIITNGKIITWGDSNEILEDHAVLIQGDRIAEVAPQETLVSQHPEVEKLDAKGQYVMPGNICAHTHFYGAYARGLAIPGLAPKDFPEILDKLWWPLDKALTRDEVRASALVNLVDAIKHGTTTLIDHHASPNAIPGSLETIGETIDQSGLRAVLCYEVTDRDGPEKARQGITENVYFLERTRDEGFANGRVAATFGLHASMTLSDTTLAGCREAVPEGVGFHVHAAEHEADEYDSLATSGMRVIDRLKKHQILGPNTIVAHAIHIDAREVALLAESKTWVTHQPRSNMNNGVGVAEVESLLRAGVRVCIGTDGFQHAMWDEWKTAYLLHKVWHRDPRRMGGYEIIQMAVTNNAALAGIFFPKAPLATIAAGAYADLILVDYRPFTPLTPGNLPWHILFGFNESMVTTTIASGRVLMRDRALLTLDEEAIFAQAMELAPEVWDRYQRQF
jgi:putative selenium metabolism protein SsnA